jgi:hypothetical protein
MRREQDGLQMAHTDTLTYAQVVGNENVLLLGLGRVATTRLHRLGRLGDGTDRLSESTSAYGQHGAC